MGIFRNFLDSLYKKSDIQKVQVIFGSLKDQLAFKKIALWTATSYIADTISKCEIKVFKNGKEVKDELYYALNYSPNINETASYFKRKLISKLLLETEALVIQPKSRNSIFLADSFYRDEHILEEDIFESITIRNESINTSYKASDVFYFRLDDSIFGTLINQMYQDYSDLVALALENYKQNKSTKYKLKLDAVKAGDEDFEKDFNESIKQQLNDFINNPKAVYPEFDGYILEEFKSSGNQTNSDEIRNLRKEVMEIIATTLKIPVSLIYGNMTNSKDIISSFVTFAIEPLTKLINEELTRKTINNVEDINGGYKVQIDITSITHLDLFDIAEKADKFISSGVYCIDELREKIGENTLDTDFSRKHYITKNYASADEALMNPNEPLKGGE